MPFFVERRVGTGADLVALLREAVRQGTVTEAQGRITPVVLETVVEPSPARIDALAATVSQQPTGHRWWPCRWAESPLSAVVVGVAWWTDPAGRVHAYAEAAVKWQDSNFYLHEGDAKCDYRGERLTFGHPLELLYPEANLFAYRTSTAAGVMGVCPCGAVGALQSLGWMGSCCGPCFDQRAAGAAGGGDGPSDGTPDHEYQPPVRVTAGRSEYLLEVRARDTGDRQRELTLGGWNRERVRAFAAGPDGSVFACFLSGDPSGLHTHLARWNASGAARPVSRLGRLLGGTADRPDRRVPLSGWETRFRYLVSTDPFHLVVSPDGGVLVGLYDEGVRFWDAHTLEELAELSRSRRFDHIGFSPDGHFLHLRAGQAPTFRWSWPQFRAALCS